jgi:sugar O-acyltransferase (sialic acid O-acetyltransferase NeuD family)
MTLALLEQGAPLTNLIHPTVSLDMVHLGIGVYIQESVILQSEVVVGHNASIHMGSLIGHESKIGDSAFIAHGCNLCGLVTVGNGTFVGAGATILPRLNIGEWSIVGAGSVVTKSVPPYTVVSGNPARKIRLIDPSEILKRRQDLGLGDIP